MKAPTSVHKNTQYDTKTKNWFLYVLNLEVLQFILEIYFFLLTFIIKLRETIIIVTMTVAATP